MGCRKGEKDLSRPTDLLVVSNVGDEGPVETLPRSVGIPTSITFWSENGNLRVIPPRGGENPPLSTESETSFPLLGSHVLSRSQQLERETRNFTVTRENLVTEGMTRMNRGL